MEGGGSSMGMSVAFSTACFARHVKPTPLHDPVVWVLRDATLLSIPAVKPVGLSRSAKNADRQIMLRGAKETAFNTSGNFARYFNGLNGDTQGVKTWHKVCVGTEPPK